MTQPEKTIITDFLQTIPVGKVFKSKEALARIWDSYSTTEKKKAGKTFFDEVDAGYWPNIRVNTHENGTATYIKIYSAEIETWVGFDVLKPFNKSSSYAEFYTSLAAGGWKVRGILIPVNSAIGGSIKNSDGYSHGVYNLNAKYTKMTAQIAVDDNSSPINKVTILFYGDIRFLGEYNLRLGDVQNIELNLTGIKTLGIDFRGVKEGIMYSVTYPVIYGAKFYTIN